MLSLFFFPMHIYLKGLTKSSSQRGHVPGLTKLDRFYHTACKFKLRKASNKSIVK